MAWLPHHDTILAWCEEEEVGKKRNTDVVWRKRKWEFTKKDEVRQKEREGERGNGLRIERERVENEELNRLPTRL
jgi:hypothetical protein